MNENEMNQRPTALNHPPPSPFNQIQNNTIKFFSISEIAIADQRWLLEDKLNKLLSIEKSNVNVTLNI